MSATNHTPESDHTHMGHRVDNLKQLGAAEGRHRRLLSVSAQRRAAVRSEVIEGSAPGVRYYLLMTIATMIAALGLVTNSPAVIIGAMLISPLMTPIFGTSLGLISGNWGLVRTALLGEFGGVALAILAGFLLGLLPLPFKVTSEMLARTSPTILDLGIAFLAGTAGCLGIIDERISPVLPGIAIATSLVPPLATCGLCLALGAPSGAWGAFLLFFANFLAILMISSMLFIGAGFVTKVEIGSHFRLLKRFSAAIIGLVLVSVLLTHTLIQIVEKLSMTRQIESVITKTLSTEPATSLREVKFKKREDVVNALATVRTQRPLSPRIIKEMEDAIEAELAFDTNLIVRCMLVRDVSATGSTSAVVDEDLDGRFISEQLNPRVKMIQLGEQSIREMLDAFPGAYLRDLDLVEMEKVPVILATVETRKPVKASDVRQAEDLIRQRLGAPGARLVVRSLDLIGMTSKGKMLYGRAHLSPLSAEDAATRDRLEQFILQEVSHLDNMYALNVDAQKENGEWAIRAEVVGPRVLDSAEAADIERRVAESSSERVRIEIWSRAEMRVTPKGYQPMETFMEPRQ